MISANDLCGLSLKLLKAAVIDNARFYFVELKAESDIRDFMSHYGDDLKCSGYEVHIITPNPDQGRGHDKFGITIAWGRDA